MLISEKNPEKARRQILKSQEDKPILVQAQEDKFNRKILEYGKFQAIVSIESGDRKEKLKNLDTGLNHVLARIAKKNNISIALDLKSISTLEKKKKAQRLSKIVKNIKVARKAQTLLSLVNSKDHKDSRALLISLGSSTKQANQAIAF